MKLTKLFETVAIKGLDRAPSNFKTLINKMIKGSKSIQIFDPEEFYSPDTTFIEFGKNTLPSSDNTLFVGNKYFDKAQQYNKLKKKVNTLKTYTDAIEVDINRMIAKRKTGMKQQGQIINKLPANPEDYIFQHLVDIEAEFRVIVYYMNGQYHVSGIYKKAGANVSISQISKDSAIGSAVADIAIKATDILGYGLGGVDVAVVSAGQIDDMILGESIMGFTASKATKLIGRIKNHDELIKGNHLIVLEVNSYPSMSNKAISHDLLKSIESNRR